MQYGAPAVGSETPALPAYTVTSGIGAPKLPVCNNHTNVGGMAYVIDEQNMPPPVYMATPVGGGSVIAKVFCTGVLNGWTLQ